MQRGKNTPHLPGQSRGSIAEVDMPRQRLDTAPIQQQFQSFENIVRR